ncbi:hypothetical protein ACPPVO_34300 [Dactylosporangium sp. McL0621]|uniref:hypothetical protein n=1 Tax=Dactylosporangium sp. McL0621 TaxID=3415678 RepID=UPI003CF07E65
MRWAPATVVAALALATLAAGEPAWGGGPVGTVTGQIDLSGGPGPGRVPAVSGTVTLSRGGRVYARAAVGEGERFRFALPAGTYRAHAHDGDARCPGITATVGPGRASDLRIVCQVK